MLRNFKNRDLVTTEKLLHSIVFINQDLTYKYNSTWSDREKKMEIPHPCFHGDLIHKAKKLKSDTFKLEALLKNLNRKRL